MAISFLIDLLLQLQIITGKFARNHFNFLSILQIVGGVLILFKKYVRIGAFIYLLSFGYFFLMDMTYYNNHYYLILILTLFFCFYPEVSKKYRNVFPNTIYGFLKYK